MTRILYASSVINFQAHASFYITTAIYSILWENLPIDLKIQMKDVFFWLNKQQNTRKINVIHQIQTSCKSVIVLVIDLQHRPLSSNPIRASKIYLAGCSLEFTIGQFLRVGWQIAIVSRYVLLYPSTLARICGMNLGVQNCFFFNCVLVDCVLWEAVNRPKMPDQFDLLSPLSSFCLRSKLFTEFILKVPLGRLVKQKLDCLIDIVHSDLFTHHGESTNTHTHTRTVLSVLRCMYLHSQCSNIGNHTHQLPPQGSPVWAQSKGHCRGV